jgi:uncharacterized protein (DUF2147 family)
MARILLLKHAFIGATAILVAAIGFATAATAQSANGIWLRPKTGGHIEAFNCGGGVGLKVVKSRKANLIGRTLMCGARPVAPGVFAGQLRNAEDGRTYSGRVTVQGRKLLLRGCLMGGLACRTETWRRLR